MGLSKVKYDRQQIEVPQASRIPSSTDFRSGQRTFQGSSTPFDVIVLITFANFGIVQHQVNELADFQVIYGDDRFTLLCDDQVMLDSAHQGHVPGRSSVSTTAGNRGVGEVGFHQTGTAQIGVG